jgi:hypothetical protein
VEKGLMTTERGRIPEHVTREYEASKRAESSRLPVRAGWPLSGAAGSGPFMRLSA